MSRNNEIIKFYQEGLSVPKIAKEFSLGRTRIYEILDSNGIKRRTGKDYKPQSGGREKEIIEYYGLGYSAANTGKEFDICESTVLYVLRKNNIAVRKLGNVGEKSSNWKGGISRDKNLLNARKRAYRSKRKQNDPLYKMTITLRSRVMTAFKRKKLKKSAPSQELLGADWKIIFAHLESQFKDGMTWRNHGYGHDKWHIDHKIPLASAKNKEELIKLFHYTNLQPLWQKENQSKGARYGY